MSYAFYFDPALSDAVWGDMDETLLLRPANVAYWRLCDLDDAQWTAFKPKQVFPQAQHVTVEILASQWNRVEAFDIQRVSVVMPKSGSVMLEQLQIRAQSVEIDVTLEYNAKIAFADYTRMLEYWMQNGVRHFSLYEVTRFPVWQKFKDFFARHGYAFYDRYHVCAPGFESPYQKHLARFGNLFALGGVSRWHDAVHGSVTRSTNEAQWTSLSDDDTEVERLLFAMADRDGIACAGLDLGQVNKACESGLAERRDDRLCPSDAGLWDTVALVSHLR